jgi:hypothetical protein
MKKPAFSDTDKKIANQAAPLAAADLIGADFWSEVQDRLIQDGELVQPRPGQASKPR